MADEKKKIEKKGRSKDAGVTLKTKASRKKGAEDIAPAELEAPRLLERYRKEIAPALIKEFNYKNIMQVPRFTKVVINAGLGRATQNIKIIDQAMKDIAAITGQKPTSRKSKVAISNFKLRAGLPIGVAVTLRGAMMYEFIDRLIHLALPRIRDFRGISDRSFDGRGNYNLGLKEQLMFPEIEFDSVENSFGFNVTICTTAETDREGLALLTHCGMPFRKKPQQQAEQKVA